MSFGNRELILLGVITLVVLGYRGGTIVADNSVNQSDDFFRWDPLIRKYSKLNQIPWRWVKAVMWNESSLGRAKSVAIGIREPSNVKDSASFDGKSWGLMQTTVATSRELFPNVTEIDLNNPEVSIKIGTAYLSKLYRRFKGDRESTIRAYNGGPGFAKTVQGRTLTPVYYARFEEHLNQILDRQPGNELEY